MHSRHLPQDGLLWAGIMLLFTVPLPVETSPAAMLAPGFWPMPIMRSVLVLVLIRFRRGRTGRSSWGIGRAAFVSGALLLLLVAAALLVDVSLGALAPFAAVPVAPAAREPMDVLLMWALAIPGLSLAALAEERFFREYTLGLMEERGVPEPICLPASALIFGAGHLGGGIPSAVFAVLAGLFLALVYSKAASVIPGAIAHGLYNLLLLLGLAAGAPMGPS